MTRTSVAKNSTTSDKLSRPIIKISTVQSYYKPGSDSFVVRKPNYDIFMYIVTAQNG